MEQLDFKVRNELEIKSLQFLISSGESLVVEFKEDRKDFSDSYVYESVVAMANAQGGTIFVGVSNDGEIIGSRRILNGTWKNIEAIAGMIMANTIPACATAVSIAELEPTKAVVVIRISKSVTTTGTKSGKFLKRILDAKGEPQNLPMTADDIVSGVSRIGIQDFSSIVLQDVSIEDIDLNLVSETAKHRSTQITDHHKKELLLRSPVEILSSFGLLNFQDSKPNIAALLLFGHAEQLKRRLPNHEIQYQVFGQRGELTKNISFSGPVATVFPKLLELPELLRNSDEFRFRGANVVIPEYPQDSIREALANAIVHRDYTLQPGIQVQLFEKELIITSPGAFPSGISLSNLLSAPPTPRNRRFAEGLREFGFVESSGRGIDFIFQGQARFGRPAPDYTGSDNDKVSVRLTGGKANLDFCRFVLSSMESPKIVELLLLNSIFFKRNQNLEQLASVIQRPLTVTQEVLVKLFEDKLIEITSEKIPSYLLKGSMNHSAMKAVKPSRLSQIQIDRFKQDLIRELQRESPNSLSVLADRVGLSPPQTRRLLVQLRTAGKISMLSGKKWKL